MSLDPTLLDRAYSIAREKQKLALQQVSSALDPEFPNSGLDLVLTAAQRGLELHLAATQLARRVWLKTLPYDKARDILRAQFDEFSSETCERAFSDAYADTR